MSVQRGKHLPFFLLVSLFVIVAGVSTNVRASTAEGTSYENDVLGVAITYPQEYEVVEQQYLSDAYGFTVVDSEKSPVFEISWLHESGAEQLDQMAEKTVEKFSSVSVKQTPIQVDQRNGVMLSPVPGVTANSLVYVSVDDRLYTLRYYNDSLDNLGWSLVNSVRFYPPSQSLNELQLTHADDVIFIPKHLEESLQPDDSEKLPLPNETSESNNPSDTPIPSSIQPGCTSYTAIVQTQWGYTANSENEVYDDGVSAAGPSFYGQGIHAGCDSNTNYNDYYAIDHPLDEWDAIYPHKSGTVIYAGWADGGWKSLGRMVIIDYGGGYWGVMAHLRYISYRAEVGDSVGSNTIIGYAGRSGNYKDDYWSGVHLHQSVNKDAKLSLNPDGIYDGQSARPHGYQYSGNGGGTYWAWNLSSGDLMSY